MLTLFTGATGAGKTAALVDYISKLPGDRPIYSDGLNGLTLPHTPCDANNWHKDLPDGAILVIDEVQRVWRPRGSAAKVPDSVAALETHRHHGIDVFMTTQAPALLDSNVRNLVGRHIHIRDTGILGRWWYEWPETSAGMQWKTCVNKRRYKLPKSAYALYKSSSLHTVPVRGIPRSLYVGIGALLLLSVMVVMIYRMIVRFSGGAVSSPLSVPASVPGPGVQRGGVMQVGYIDRNNGPIDDRVDWTPRVSNRPESAPAYDALRKVAVMPRVVGGYCQAGECRCINQQGTDSGLSSNECGQWLKSPPFDPYPSGLLQRQQDAPQIAPQATPSALVAPSEILRTSSLPSKRGAP
jgi:zona occludens toxin